MTQFDEDTPPRDEASSLSGGGATAPGDGSTAPFETADFPRRLKVALKAGTRAARFGRPFRFLDEVGSTNDVAREWVEASAPEGAMVIALSQTAGCGRAGRAWISAAGAGLWFSLVLRPDLDYPQAGMVPLAMGFGLVLALRRLGLPARLKWPNDIVVRGGKLGGILVEGTTAAGRLATAVAGVGVNWCRPILAGSFYPVTGLIAELRPEAGVAPASPLPAPVAPPALVPPAPEDVLVALLGGLEQAYLVLKAAGPAPFMAAWPRVCAHFGRVVIYRGPAGEGPGLPALGGSLLPDGSLEVLTFDGRRRQLVAGEVNLSLPPR
jgi:BirA family biotin operon repressor/biotin-[acetyl-CoA-carboxylase] ligase